jgi:prolyl-tRNA synthetase
MKDLYTFDRSVEDAMATYKDVRSAYDKIFAELRLPVLVAEASSGDMGGDLSHEYHLVSAAGEDDVAHCPSCGYTANTEVAKAGTGESVRDGAACPACPSGTLALRKAVELGHTFFLGTRYSAPLELRLEIPGQGNQNLQMGCYGIGVSRLVAAAAEHFRLSWPRVIAPFEVLVVHSDERANAAAGLYDELSHGEAPIDIMLDDRPVGMGRKIEQAGQVGYPVVVVVGKHWPECEVHCRALEQKQMVDVKDVPKLVKHWLSQL